MLGKRQLVTDSALTLAVLSALLLIAARPAQTQTEKVLYNFTGGTDGGNPYSRLTSDSAGNFYGTTFYGGFGLGTVFELSPNGSGGWNETTLYTFTGGADGGESIFLQRDIRQRGKPLRNSVLWRREWTRRRVRT